MEVPDIAVQIVNYKTKQFIGPLIASIVKDIRGSKLKIEINILDNASGDNLKDIAETRSNQGVRLYQSITNGGFGAGQNILASKTKAKYLLLLNPDLLFIEEHTIERLLRTLEKTQASVVGPRLLTPLSHQSTPLTNPSLSQLKQQPWDHGKGSLVAYRIESKLAQADWVSGAVFLVNAEDFLNAGGFDERFFLYYEEVDLCLALRKKHKLIIYDPTIQVLHYGGVVATKRSLYALKSYIYFQLKKVRRYFTKN